MGKAKELGPPADIYSLGAVMYDMLTGRPPFRGVTVMDTLNQVQKLEPLPPVRLAPKVPIDLQTICLKALQKDQKKRYATAGDMAADLDRYLNGEPILARPTPLWERSLKWVKRRPALATLISVSTLAFFSLLTVGGLWLNSEREQEAALKEMERQGRLKEEGLKVEAEKERDEAERQRNLAQDSLKHARQAVQYMLTRVGSSDLRNEPKFELVRKDLLDKALAFNKEFLASGNVTAPALKFEVAMAFWQVGDINKELGNLDEAVKQYQKATERFIALQKENPNKGEYEEGVYACFYEQASALRLLGNLSDSENCYQQALDLVDRLAKRFPGNQNYVAELANIRDDLATLDVSLNRLKEAEVNFAEALRLRANLRAKGVNDPGAWMREARTKRNWAIYLFKVGKRTEAEKSWKAARVTVEDLAKEFPMVPDYVSECVACCLNLAYCYRETDRMPLAAATLREAIARLQKLAKDFPNTPEYCAELAKAHYELGDICSLQNQFQEAYDQFAEALKIRNQLFAAHKLPALRLQLAESQDHLGRVLKDLNRVEEAVEHFRLAIQLLEETKPAANTSPNEVEEIATVHENLGHLLVALMQPLEADKSWERLLAARKELVEAFPQSKHYRIALGQTYQSYAIRYMEGGKNKEAIIHFKGAAATYAQGMVVVEADTTLLTPETRKTELESFGNAAIEMLQSAVKLGFSDVDYLQTAPEFQVLRLWPEFARLMREMKNAAGKDPPKK